MAKFKIILEALKAGKTVEIDNTWYFTGHYMTCSGASEEYTCCSDSYASIEEAADNAFMMGDVTDIY